MDKRRRVRKKTRLAARFGASRPERFGMIIDASSAGFFLSTNAVLPRGSIVHVQVSTPAGPPLDLRGRVMRARRVPPQLVMLVTGGMGVRLEEVPPGWRESLALPEES